MPTEKAKFTDYGCSKSDDGKMPRPHPELILVALGWQQIIAEFGNPLLLSVGIMLAGSNRVKWGVNTNPYIKNKKIKGAKMQIMGF